MASRNKDKSNEIIGLIHLLIGVFLAVAFYIPAVNSGPLGTLLLNIAQALVGPVAYVFPFLFFFLSITMFLKNLIRKHKIRVNHIFLLLIVIAAFIHSITTDLDSILALSYDDGQQQTVFKALEILVRASISPETFPNLLGAKPGGILGGFVAMGLQRITGEFGATALLLTALIAEAIVLGNLSIERILHGIARVLRFIFHGLGGLVSNATEAIYTLTDQEEASGPDAPPSRSQRKNKQELAKNNYNTSIPIEGMTSRKQEDFQMPREISDSGQDKKGQFDFIIDGIVEPEEERKTSGPFNQEIQTPNFNLLKKDPAPEISNPPDADTTYQIEGLEGNVVPEQEDKKSDINQEFIFGDDKRDMSSGLNKQESHQDNEAIEENIEDIPDLLEEAEKEKPYEFPPITLLEPRPVINSTSNAKRIKDLALRLEQTLKSFGVEAKVVYITTGPSITRFELKPGPGVKISKIVGLSDDIALSLAATTVRIEAPIPGKSAVGIEIPNSETATVGLRSLIENEEFQRKKEKLTVPLGRDIPGQSIYCDLAKMPHLLIAGATGSGKSVCINTILLSLLYRCSPKELRLILIDPKVVELSVYNGIPHLLAPVVTDPKKAANTLNWAVEEMSNRYKAFAEYHVRDMRAYNELAEKEGRTKLPFIVLVIDELSDLMATSAREVEEAISRLTAMARAAGIHLVIATQRPSVDVITGVIKANIPSRIAFAVSSQVDSRTILDGSGAEKLLGKGDMLYSPQSASKATRGQGAFVDDHEVENVISFLKAQKLRTYDKDVAEKILSTPAPGVDTGGSDASPDDDELLPEAVDIILDAGYASVSLIQRRLNVGHPRAGRLIDAMEMKGYVGPHEGSKPRRLILTRSEWAIINAQDNQGSESIEE